MEGTRDWTGRRRDAAIRGVSRDRVYAITIKIRIKMKMDEDDWEAAVKVLIS